LFLGVERKRCLRLTTLPPSVSRLSKQSRIFNISQPYRPSRPVTETNFFLNFYSFSFIALGEMKDPGPDNRNPLWRAESAWEDNTETYRKQRIGSMDWTHVAQDRH
jgi:hypothetical protein